MAKDLISQILDIISDLFGVQKPQQIAPIPEPVVAKNATVVSVDTNPLPPQFHEIDWSNPEAKISDHFTVKEALWLPSWQVMHIPSEEEKSAIVEHAKKMDLIRDFLGVPLNVHCWIRPILNNPQSEYHGQDYNALVKGAKDSAHKYGIATDYDAKGLNCDDVRTKLEPKLEEFGLRMEQMPGGNWVHNDSREPLAGHPRFFKP